MRITICGAVREYQHIRDLHGRLEEYGHVVLAPPSTITDATGGAIPVEVFRRVRHRAITEGRPEDQWVWALKESLMRRHYNKVANCNAIVVCNYPLYGRPGYIGANTFGEMILAHFLGRPIYLQHPFDPDSPFAEELRSMGLILLNDDLTLIVTANAASP